MSKETNISWCDSTFNSWIGCRAVSPGCQHCYAKTMTERFGHDFATRRRTSPANWKQPVKWNREAAKDGTRPRVFCGSMMDWLDDEVPVEWLADLLELIRLTPNLDWLLLSKRPQNWMPRMTAVRHHLNGIPLSNPPFFWLASWTEGKPPENVWIGTTVEDQQGADERIPILLGIPAKVRFLSCEPLLGPVDLEHCGPEDLCDWIKRIEWVICGGESGPKCRPMDVEWARSLRDQCAASHVPFFMKQIGGHPNPLHNLEDLPEDLRIREFPTP